MLHGVDWLSSSSIFRKFVNDTALACTRLTMSDPFCLLLVFRCMSLCCSICFLFRLLMRNVLTICVLICPIKCVSLYPVFRLNIHVFHAFGIFNVFVSLFICVVMIICEFICFFFFMFFGIYIHVICKHILLVWFSSLPS